MSLLYKCYKCIIIVVAILSLCIISIFIPIKKVHRQYFCTYCAKEVTTSGYSQDLQPANEGCLNAPDHKHRWLKHTVYYTSIIIGMNLGHGHTKYIIHPYRLREILKLFSGDDCSRDRFLKYYNYLLDIKKDKWDMGGYFLEEGYILVVWYKKNDANILEYIKYNHIIKFILRRIDILTKIKIYGVF